jgi:glycosyltransferase involved in cell wall biosynthesis
MSSPRLPEPSKVLALEPYYGGSHRGFLDGWAKHSRLNWTILGLPSHHWKWRMRHAALTMADQVRRRFEQGERWDLLWCSDMLNLAEFRGLAPEPVSRLPAVAYFHENQLTYPVRVPHERDYHFAISNLMTALAADETWFNSQFHKDELLCELRSFLQRMPDYQSLDGVDRIAEHSHVHPPGIERFAPPQTREPGPLRLLWAARWEHDKNPDAFFAALELLEQHGVDFRINVIGQSFRQSPDIFDAARKRWIGRIDRWGFQPTREAYITALQEADVFVSTADHEFFGIAAVEAMAAGCYPLLPERLSYPELLRFADRAEMSEFFYSGSHEELAHRLRVVSELVLDRARWQAAVQRVRKAVERFEWSEVADSMDAALLHLTR